MFKFAYFRYNVKNLKNLFFNFKTFFLSYMLKNNSRTIGCVMCVWDEEENIEDAINSSKDIVSKYYIIDKNGRMKNYLDQFLEEGLNIYYEIKPKMNLQESRRYAINLMSENWVLIQDGDEIVLEPELVKALTDKQYVCYQTRMIADNGNRIQPYHTFLFHKTDIDIKNKDNSLKFGRALHYFEVQKDIPRYKGRYIRLNKIVKENRNLKKSRKRELRKYWEEWQYSNYDGSLEEYVREKYKIECFN